MMASFQNVQHITALQHSMLQCAEVKSQPTNAKYLSSHKDTSCMYDFVLVPPFLSLKGCQFLGLGVCSTCVVCFCMFGMCVAMLRPNITGPNVCHSGQILRSVAVYFVQSGSTVH